MRLLWKEVMSSEMAFETPIPEAYLVLREEKSNICYLGRIEGKQGIVFQIDSHSLWAVLKEIKRKGGSPNALTATFIFRPHWRSYNSDLKAFFAGYGIGFKSVELEEKDDRLLRVVPHDLEIFLSKKKTKKDEIIPLATRVRVLIVEDSLPVQKILKKILTEMPQVEVVGIESNPKSAVEKLKKTQPDFVTLDLNLEGGTGLDFLEMADFKSYAEKTRARCVLVTDCTIDQHGVVSEALQKGASSYLQKPELSTVDLFSKELAALLASDIDLQKGSQRSSHLGKKAVNLDSYKLIAIGSSTGGTEVVVKLLKGLPKKCPPIVIVQHMPRDFTGPFAGRLALESQRRVTEVKTITRLRPNEAYLASGDTHLVVEHRGEEYFVKPSNAPPVNRFRPSVSVLYDSISQTPLLPRTVALMLTGMGSDGALEMLALKRGGALTIGQSKESCVVYGMPKAAEEMGALCLEASPEEMIAYLSSSKEKAS